MVVDTRMSRDAHGDCERDCGRGDLPFAAARRRRFQPGSDCQSGRPVVGPVVDRMCIVARSVWVVVVAAIVMPSFCGRSRVCACVCVRVGSSPPYADSVDADDLFIVVVADEGEPLEKLGGRRDTGQQVDLFCVATTTPRRCPLTAWSAIRQRRHGPAAGDAPRQLWPQLYAVQEQMHMAPIESSGAQYKDAGERFGVGRAGGRTWAHAPP